MPDSPRPARKNTGGNPESVVVYTAPSKHGLPPNNLPLQLTSFVGRERKMARGAGLLAGHRLLTLTGPGGSGKTRLALTVASGAAERFENGVWLVELASLSDPDLVPQAMASVLGVRETPGTPLVDSLRVHLENRQILLVLDNCEHLVEACADLAGTLLRSCPDLRILATSREALGVPGETVFPVPPLSLPDPRHLPAVESLSHYEAARLFVERARGVRPDFALTEQNALAAAQICYRLDGMPLAIELAAARAKVLSIEQISSRLEDSFALLSGRGRTAMPRHRTLRATMDWSYGLLSNEEKTLLRSLSTFAGSFTLEAAEVVCAGEDLERGEVLDLLTSLVDKSLVLVTERDREARYRLLGMVRQHGWEKLQELDGTERVRGRHAEYYLSLAEEVEPEPRGQGTWLRRLGSEHDNFRAALRWALGPEATAPKAELELRLAAALGQRGFWAAFGPNEGRGWVDTGLASTGMSPRSLRARALYEASWLATVQGDHENSVVWLRESLDTFKELGDLAGAANSLALLGQMMISGGDRERIDSLRDEAETLRGDLSDRQATARLLIFLSLAAWDRGDYGQTVELAEHSLALSRELGDLYAITLCSGSLGFAVLDKGETDRAGALFAESLRALRELQDKEGIFYCLLGTAGVAG
ncbi:MAG: ATP-binding protein, partial [Rubrobacter sp.]